LTLTLGDLELIQSAKDKYADAKRFAAERAEELERGQIAVTAGKDHPPASRQLLG